MVVDLGFVSRGKTCEGFERNGDFSPKLAVRRLMKRRLVSLLLLALSIGCDPRPQLRSAKDFSTEPATWHGGAWDGRSGTAVTIQFKDGTEQFWRAEEVTFTFGGRDLPVSDFTVPVMKREPHALTLFFQNEETTLGVLKQLPDQIEAGTLAVIPCIPDRIC
jgi:hypothetical protein